MEPSQLPDKAINRSSSEDKICLLDIPETQRREPPVQKKRKRFRKLLKRRLFATRRMTKNHFRKGLRIPKIKFKFPKPSLPGGGALFLLAIFIFSFMCYLLGVDPTYIPFTLVFTFVMTMILLEEKQRDLLIEKIFPQFAINFFRWIWAFVCSPTKKKNENEFEYDNVNEDKQHNYIQMQHHIKTDDLEYPILCL